MAENSQNSSSGGVNEARNDDKIVTLGEFIEEEEAMDEVNKFN